MRPAKIFFSTALGAALVGALVAGASYRGGMKIGVGRVSAAEVASTRLAAPVDGPGLRPQDRLVIERLLGLARDQPAIGQRMKTISAQLLGRPYVDHPLIGSPVKVEQFVVRLDGFDCVTFLETVLALSGAHDVDGFLERLRQIRYENDVVSYQTRLHYMMDWNESNVRRGVLRDLTGGVGPMEQVKTLNVVAGFQPRTVVLHYFHAQHIEAISRWLEDGDLIYFVSGRRSLDVFHVGLVVWKGDRVLLRHASSHQRKVIDQDLAGFVRKTGIYGFILARPAENRIEGSHPADQRGLASASRPGVRTTEARWRDSPLGAPASSRP